MPGRSISLVNGEIYHLYNRGSEKRDIFTQLRDYKRFRNTFRYYQFAGPKPRLSISSFSSFIPDPSKKLVEILCFCLMPNHFHFLVKQLKVNGISIFMGQLANSYTKYFNTKYNRIGSLLQGTFRAVTVESDDQLIHLSRYIHLNPVVSGVCASLNEYSWSSFEEYIGSESICFTSLILNMFPSKEKYIEFTKDQSSYGATLEILKHQIIEND